LFENSFFDFDFVYTNNFLISQKHCRAFADPTTIMSEIRSEIIQQMSLSLQELLPWEATNPNPKVSAADVAELNKEPTQSQYKAIITTAKKVVLICRKNAKEVTKSVLLDLVTAAEAALKQSPVLVLAQMLQQVLMAVARPLAHLEAQEESNETIQAEGCFTLPKCVQSLIKEYFGGGDVAGDEIQAIPLWYCGRIKGKDAEQLFREKVNGTFLVRCSDTLENAYNVSVRQNDKVYHFRIHQNTEGMIYVTDEYKFLTLAELIHFHAQPFGIAEYTVSFQCAVLAYASNPWFHGSVTKESAEDILSKTGAGDFLVRRGKRDVADGDDVLILSLSVQGSIQHFQINHDAADMTLGLNKDVRFKSLAKLIEFYARKDSTGPRLFRHVNRSSNANVDMNDAENTTYVNINKEKVNPVALTPSAEVGSGFGAVGFYQRRWMKQLEKTIKK